MILFINAACNGRTTNATISTGITGESACAELMGSCAENPDSQPVDPCYAERRYGAVADDEMLMACPPEDLQRAVTGLHGLAKAGLRYPIMPFGPHAEPAEGMAKSWSTSVTTARWHWAMVEEVAPAFRKATGIKVDTTLLPVDPWRARLRAELGAGSGGIDIVQWSVGMAGWIAPHMANHEPLLAEMKSRHADFGWDELTSPAPRRPRRTTASWSASRTRITTRIFHYQKSVLLERAEFSPTTRHVGRIPQDRARREQATRSCYAFGIFGRQGAGMFVGFNPLDCHPTADACSTSRPERSSSTTKRASRR